MRTGASLPVVPFQSHLFLHSEARILFRAGKNRDGWFSADDLLAQVDRAMDIFEGLTGGYAQGLFLFDNVPSHQKCAENALSARKMVKGACFFIPQMRYPHPPPQDQKMGGRITAMAFACVTALYPPGKHNFSITQTTTNPCPVISRAWNKSFVNATCGQRGGCRLSAQISSAPPIVSIAAAAASFISNPTSYLRSHSSRRRSSSVAIFATSTPSTIAN